MNKAIATSIALSLTALGTLSGCSTKPRNFQPIVAPPPADPAAFQKVVDDCIGMVRSGRKSDFANALAVGAGTGAGAVVGAIGAGTLSTAAGAGFTGASSAAAVAFPIIGIGVGFGISRAIRSGREKKIKAAMTTCLGEFGYTVSSWEVIRKTKKKAAAKSQEVTLQWVGVRTL
jgi:hypothetical protein